MNKWCLTRITGISKMFHLDCNIMALFYLICNLTYKANNEKIEISVTLCIFKGDFCIF